MTLEITNSNNLIETLQQTYPIVANVGFGDLGSFQAAALAAEEDADRAEAARDDASAIAGIREFQTVTVLLANATLSYTAGTGLVVVSAGDVIRTRAEGFAYQVAASGASDHHVTTAGGVKLYVVAKSDAYNFRAFGVKGDGTDETTAMQRAVAAVNAHVGPVSLVGNPGDVYFFTSDLVVTRSHCTIDLRWARVTANARFSFTGNSLNLDGAMEPANESLLLQNVHFRNAFFGNPDNFDAITRGPIMSFVRDSSISNCIKFSRGGTSFNLFYARRSTIRNVMNWGARQIGLGGTIGILLLHTHDCTVEDCVVGGPGEWVYVVQQKGGYNNRWINVRGINVEYNNTTGQIIRDRGDDPYGSSLTGGPYPYSSGSWAAPDSRRASHATEWINCGAVNCPDQMPGLFVQEARDSRIVGFRATNARGIVLSRHASAATDYDDGYEVVDYRGDNVNIPLSALSDAATPMRRLTVRGVRVRGVRSITFATQREIHLINVENPQISEVDVETTDGVSESFLRLENVVGGTFTRMRAVGTYTGTPMVNIGTTRNANFVDCDTSLAVGVSVAKFGAVPGLRSRETLAGAFQTTGTNFGNLVRASLPPDTTAYLTAQFIGRGVGTDSYMRYTIGRLFKTTGTTLTALGSAVNEIENIRIGNAVNWLGQFAIVSDQVRIQCRGNTGDTVNWEVRYTWGEGL